MANTTNHTSAISAKKVLGTTVKDMAGQKIGHIEDIVLDKLSSNIVFAVVSFGGFLGIGEKYHPIPWSALDYNPEENGYVVKYTRDQLAAAPFDTIDELIADDAQRYRSSSSQYYGTPVTPAPAVKSVTVIKTAPTAKPKAPVVKAVAKPALIAPKAVTASKPKAAAVAKKPVVAAPKAKAPAAIVTKKPVNKTASAPAK